MYCIQYMKTLGRNLCRHFFLNSNIVWLEFCFLLRKVKQFQPVIKHNSLYKQNILKSVNECMEHDDATNSAITQRLRTVLGRSFDTNSCG